MAPQKSDKPRRRKNRKSRTEVSSGCESESDVPQQASEQPSEPPKKCKQELNPSIPTSPKHATDPEISALFTKFYMQRVTSEFSEDLDKLRQADDFKNDALPLLINALQQGTSLFRAEDKRRIVLAGLEKKESVCG
ncbi:uncharacterized protein PAC_07417 [Phialocephala subalpina]|uniref:Ribosome assembly protein 3 n=1 Tax=Phialocephala subalpina TaxID=576137 RepID=A0A1L7WXM7_9HELO|nr:uncharacterized protein PAC_07417 [Phialocephala subalpina]